MIDVNLLTTFEWPELKNPLAIFEIQKRMLWNKKPLWFEQATQEELEKELYVQFEIESKALSLFGVNNFEFKKYFSDQAAEEIRYAFKSWCIIKTVSNITFDLFVEFANRYGITTKEITIFFGVKPNSALPPRGRLPKEVRKIKTTMYSYICSLETDMAFDQYPRQWYKYIKYFDADGKEVVTSATSDEQSMYEEDVLRIAGVSTGNNEAISDIQKLLDSI